MRFVIENIAIKCLDLGNRERISTDDGVRHHVVFQKKNLPENEIQGLIITPLLFGLDALMH